MIENARKHAGSPGRQVVARPRLGRVLVLAGLLAACDPGPGPGAGGETPAGGATAELGEVRAGDLGPQELARAEALLLGERFGEAAELLEPGVDRDRPSGRAELLYALSQHKQKRYARARPWFEAAAAAPGDWPGRESVDYYLAWCLYNLGELELAEARFEAHLAEVPDEGDSWFGLGLVASDRGDLELAVERFERAIELFEVAIDGGKTGLEPSLAKAWARLGETERLRDRPARARDALLECVGIYPGHATAWYQLNEVLLELGEDQAAADAREAYERLQPAGAR